MDQMLFGRISYKSVFRIFWASLLMSLLLFIGLFYYVANTKMPDTSDLENPKFEESSVVYAQRGEEIDRYFRKNRKWVNFEQLSPHLVDALIATEDHRFYEHSGIDPKGTARAVLLLGMRGGASTITQQLAKLFFTPLRSSNPVKRIWQKMKEWVIAAEFERRYTKEELIAMFLNKFDFIHNANGVSAAAQVYFGKDQKDLTVDEAAMLIGMLKNPYYFNPKSRTERAQLRRNVVLSQMRKNGFISPEEYKNYSKQDIDVSKFTASENYSGLAPYFMAELKKHIREVLNNGAITKPGGEPYDLDVDGLKIYTTINATYQKHAENAAIKHIATVQRNFFKTWQGKDPWTYDADKNQLRSRNATLSNLVEETNRYSILRKAYLNDIIQQVSDNFEDARLWNSDIRRLYRAESDPNYLDKSLKDGYITSTQKVFYTEILKSAFWPKIKQAWSNLEKAVQNDFSKKRAMTLYSYEGPVTKSISPIDSIKYMSMFMQIGSVAIEPHTGFVRAWIGGADFTQWKYDHVTSNRQVGSTFKPFLYTTALLNSISPCWPVDDIQYTISPGEGDFGLSQSWSPKNTRGEFSNQKITLKEGLKQSLNSISVWLVKQLGSVDGIISLAENMGIDKGKIPRYPSIVLGSPTLSVLEMTGAYSTFANNGTSSKPQVIERIEDKNGRPIYIGEVSQKRTIPENINYAMVELLKNATSAHSYRLKSDWGGKTGTTNDHVDGWFMGITPNLVVGTWVGGEYSWIRFRSLDLGQGSVMARPFFIDFVSRLEEDPSSGYNALSRFSFPADIGIELNCDYVEKIQDDEIELFDEELDEQE